MSADLTIEATVITQSGTDLTPVGVTIKGTGSIPNGALRAIAQEALAAFTGSHESHHGFKVSAEPSFHEETDDTVTIFPVFKSLAARK
jgi:hypothetical protein